MDWIGLMSYDLHGSWDPVTGHHAGLYPRAAESDAQKTLNVVSFINKRRIYRREHFYILKYFLNI